jgi:hypothetical protein
MKKTNETPSCCNTRRNRRVKPSANRLTRFRFVLAGLAFIAGLLPALPASAQNTITAYQLRTEVPAGYTGTVLLMTNTLRIPTNGASTYILKADGTNYWVIPDVNVSITGAPSFVTATLVDSGLVNPIGTIPVNGLNITNSTASNTNLVVNLNFTSPAVSGTYTMSINAIGGFTNNFLLLTLEVGKIWNGLTNAASNGAGNWSDGTKWLGGGAPGTNDNVIFTDLGEQTNNWYITATSTNLLTNSIVDTNFTIASLRFAQTNGTAGSSIVLANNIWHNLYINDGKTLALKGNDGFSMLRDITFQQTRMTVTIAGTNGTLIQTNENSNFSMLVDGQAVSILDMSGLGNLHLDVKRIAIGDIEAYPNYTNLFPNRYSQNGTTMGTALPARVLPNWNMALTNYVRAVYADPYNYTNAASRSYAMEIGRNNYGGGSSAADHVVNMGCTNAFYLDSICVAGYASLGGTLQFQTTNSGALFRNTNGGRMSIFATADAAGTNYGTTVTGDNTKCATPGVDFSKGYVDMLVDRLYLSMDRGNVTSSGKGTSQTAFVLASGIIDANTAIFGYESQTTQTNASSCYATVTVSNTAVLKVNGTLTLGYTAAAASDVSAPVNGYGQLSIGPGGTVIAGNINIGGLTKASGGVSTKGNNITLTSGATLVVSNTMGSADAGGAVGNLSFGGNCTNELFIDGLSMNAAYVYASNLTATATAGSTIYIGGIKNLSYPATVPLISYHSGTPSFNVRMPLGFAGSGSLVSTTIGGNPGFNLVISTNAPKHLVWRGGNGTWDNTSANWLDQNTSLLTTFDNGDIVAFDDNSGSTISLDAGSSPLLPSAINMTNNSLSFVFNGSGSIQGSGAFVKQGTNSLEIDAAAELPVQLNQGSLTGTGTNNGVTLASGTTMSYGGTINGSITCAGTATFLNSSIISGPLTVQNGGIVTNDSPSVDLGGSLSLLSGAFLYNTANGIIDDFTMGTITNNATLINNGELGNNNIFVNTLTVNGTLEDTGVGYFQMNTLTIASNGVFIPGGDDIGTTTVWKEGSAGTLTSPLYPGAVLLQAGSTNIFKVDAGATPLTNTMLLAFYQSFGASVSTPAQKGCTLIISNVNVSTPLTAGKYFQLFQNPNSGNVASTGSSTNTFPVIIPVTPGPGLAWDLRYLWGANPNASGNWGFIGVIAVATNPPVVGMSITPSNSFVTITSYTTNNSIVTTNFATNNVLFTYLNWPQTNTGWRLESQLNNPLTIGLSNNWAEVFVSRFTNGMSFTNSLTTNSCSFYRMLSP